MPYTLAMFFVWGLVMALIGVVIGWSLRSLRGRFASRTSTADKRELERLERRVAELEPVVRERDRLRMELADIRGSSAGVLGFASSAPVDLDAAREVLGRDVELDDLTIIEGIGPKVVELCAGIGVRTWRQLADTDPAILSTMLADGGSRFASADPSTWPRQAALLADGRWEEYEALAGEVGRG